MGMGMQGNTESRLGKGNNRQKEKIEDSFQLQCGWKLLPFKVQTKDMIESIVNAPFTQSQCARVRLEIRLTHISPSKWQLYVSDVIQIVTAKLRTHIRKAHGRKEQIAFLVSFQSLHSKSKNTHSTLNRTTKHINF